MRVFVDDGGLSSLSGPLMISLTLVLLMLMVLMLLVLVLTATLILWRVYRRIRRWQGWHRSGTNRERPVTPGTAEPGFVGQTLWASAA